jgi:hypothetical protein
MQLKRTRNCFTALAVAALTAGSATATTLTYTTLATWVAGLPAPHTNVEAQQFQYTPSQTLTSTTLFANGYGTFVGSGSVQTLYSASSGNPLGLGLRDTTETIAAPAGGTNALFLWLGANQVGSPLTSSQALTITLTDSSSNTQTFNLTTGSNSPAFWGFTSGATINTITITGPSGYNVDLMDFYAGTFPADQTSSTPEVTTLLMIGTGLVVIGARRKFLPLISA